jgi:hypothetical protein
MLTLGMRKNRAAVRYWLWPAAPLKFLIRSPSCVTPDGISSVEQANPKDQA